MVSSSSIEALALKYQGHLPESKYCNICTGLPSSSSIHDWLEAHKELRSLLEASMQSIGEQHVDATPD